MTSSLPNSSMLFTPPPLDANPTPREENVDSKLMQREFALEENDYPDSATIDKWRREVTFLGTSGHNQDAALQSLSHLNSCLEWMSKPNPSLLGDALGSGLFHPHELPMPGGDGKSRRSSAYAYSHTNVNSNGNKIPSITEWSLDHHVLTLPLTTNYDDDEPGHQQRKVDVLIHLLNDGEHGKEPGLVPLSLDSDQTPFQRLSDPTIERLVAAVLKAQDGDTVPHNRIAPWRIIAEWFWGASPRPLTVYTVNAHLNCLRCPEYDDLQQALPIILSPQPPKDTEQILPYRTAIWEVCSHMSRLGNEKVRRVRVFDDLAGFAKGDWEELKSACGLAEVLNALVGDIQSELACFRSLPLQFRSRYMEEQKDEYKCRLHHYPAGGFVDAALTIAIDGLVDTLSEVFSVDDLQHSFLFVKAVGDRSSPRSLHLPIVLINHQREGLEHHVSTINQQRIFCISAAKFLAVLGITDFPVYSLATFGSRGTLFQAWFSEETQCYYIVDRLSPAHDFDLRERKGVLRYIRLLCRLEEHGKELQRRFEDIKPSLLERVGSEEGRASLRWTLRSQMEQYSEYLA